MGHAMAMVRWSVFRPGDSGGVTHDYGSDQRRLVKAVGDGGTLWLVTSRRRGSAPRAYHLAYKLSGCRPIDPGSSAFSGDYQYVVRATAGATHFGFNDATEVIRKLVFAGGRPMAAVSNVGMRLMSIPALTGDDVELLEAFEHRLETGRSVFLSYARADEPLVSDLEAELSERNITCARDMTFLRAGDNWAAALEREVRSVDSFVVVVTPAAAGSDWVHREVEWAIGQVEAGRIVERIVPLVVDQSGWEAFPELARFQAFEMHAPFGSESLDRLADQLRM